MGAGSGNGSYAGSISITNYTKESIEVVAIDGDRAGEPNSDINCIDINKKKYTIPPKESFVFFTSEVGSLHWEKTKQG